MARPVTIFTAQYGDLPSEELFKIMSEIGYEGLELACGACVDESDPLKGHFDVHKALDDPGYCDAKKAQLAKYGLKCWAVSNHCVGQGVLDNIDSRNLTVIPPYLHGDKTVESVRALCAQEMMDTARAAAKFGVTYGHNGSVFIIFDKTVSYRFVCVQCIYERGCYSP